MKNGNILLNRIKLYLFYNKQILYLFLSILINISHSNGKLVNLKKHFSEIHLILKGSGNRTILNKGYKFEPSFVEVNGESKNCKKSCNFQDELNNVTLYYNYSISTCEKMFCGLKNIIEIDMTKFDFSNVTITISMFEKCNSLKKIDFGNINTSSLTTLESMFNGCSNLTSIDLSKFNTNKVKSFYNIFYNCQNLETINLGNLDTSSASNLIKFFSHCEKLESIDISSFNTSSVTNMFHMFFHCYSLKIIIFPPILDVSKVETMDGIFSNCRSLIALNLSNFYLNDKIDIKYMFHNCTKLKYIDLSNFPNINLKFMEYSFRFLSSLVYLNIPNIEINNNTNMTKTFEFHSSFLKVCSKQQNMIQFKYN